MKYLLSLLIVGCVHFKPAVQEPVQCKSFELYHKNKCISDCQLGDPKACYNLCSELHPYSCK